MAENENRSGILEVIAICALIFLFWKYFRKKPAIIQREPAMTAKEVEDQFRGDPNFNLNEYCQNVVYKPLDTTDLKPADLLGNDWCTRGDRSVIDDKKGYGDEYANEQAKDYIAMKEAEAIMVNNKLCLQFKLQNTGIVPITTKLLNTTQESDVFNPTYTYSGLLFFNGINNHILLDSVPDVTGNKTIRFKLYIDDLTSVSSCIMSFGDVQADLFHIFIRESGKMVFFATNSLSADNKEISMTGLGSAVLDFEITKSAGKIETVKINNVLQALSDHATQILNTESGRRIGANNLGNNLVDATIWDVEIDGIACWAGHPAGNTSGAWADSVGTNNGTLIGYATTIRNID